MTEKFQVFMASCFFLFKKSQTSFISNTLFPFWTQSESKYSQLLPKAAYSLWYGCIQIPPPAPPPYTKQSTT